MGKVGLEWNLDQWNLEQSTESQRGYVEFNGSPLQSHWPGTLYRLEFIKTDSITIHPV